MRDESDYTITLNCTKLFLVCVEVLRPSQPIGVLLSAFNLPNNTFSWAGLVLWAVNQYLCTFICQILTTALLESVEGNDRRKYFVINLHKRILPDPIGIEPMTWSPVGALTFTTVWANIAQMTFYSLFFPENSLWHFMQVDRRKYFEINLHKRILPDPAEIEPVTWSPIGALTFTKMTFYSLFFPENRLWHFMQAGDNLH